jgi:hypothetical protein
MADSHGAHDPHAHGPSKGHDAHAHHAPEEDPLRTPGWMPVLGLGLFIAGAIWMYLYVSPGVWSASTAGDAGADESAIEQAPPAPAH